MDTKLILGLTSQAILDKTFPGVSRGYDPLLVDEFLDNIIKDYLLVEANSLVTKEYTSKLENEVESLKKQNNALQIENARYKARFENIKEGDTCTSDNMELIKRINKLERLLFENGISLDESN